MAQTRLLAPPCRLRHAGAVQPGPLLHLIRRACPLLAALMLDTCDLPRKWGNSAAPASGLDASVQVRACMAVD
jgi:hypothetical protein